MASKTCVITLTTLDTSCWRVDASPDLGGTAEPAKGREVRCADAWIRAVSSPLDTVPSVSGSTACILTQRVSVLCVQKELLLAHRLAIFLEG